MEKIGLLFENHAFTISFVLVNYLFSVWVYKRLKISVLHPVLLSILFISIILLSLNVEYSSFEKGSFIIDFLLGPSVVALGYGLYEQFELIKKHKISILTSIFIGSVIGVVSVVLIARLFGADEIIVTSMKPKSVTTPIAILLSKQLGGIPPFTAVVVMLTGVFGAVVGPFVLDKAGITSKIARGLAMGSCAHGVGTARAIEMGAVEGVISGLTIGLMGLFTSIILSISQWIF